jgi:hypothetical protein
MGLEVRPHHQRASLREVIYENEKLTASEWNDPPAHLRPMYGILTLFSTLEECGDFFEKFAHEPQEDLNFAIAQTDGVKALDTHMA